MPFQKKVAKRTLLFFLLSLSLVFLSLSNSRAEEGAVLTAVFAVS